MTSEYVNPQEPRRMYGSSGPSVRGESQSSVARGAEREPPLTPSLARDLNLAQPHPARQVRLALPLEAADPVRSDGDALHDVWGVLAAEGSLTGELRNGREAARSGAAVGVQGERRERRDCEG